MTQSFQVGLASSTATLAKEQQALVAPGGQEQEPVSRVDILVTTPGRLMEHVAATAGFTLRHVRFVVVDEADRLLASDFNQWISPLWSIIDAHKQQVSKFELYSFNQLLLTTTRSSAVTASSTRRTSRRKGVAVARK